MEIRFKRFLSLAMAIIMVVSMMPTNIVFATENEGTPESVVTETTPPETSEPEETTSEKCKHENKTTTTTDATCTAAGAIVVACADCGVTISSEEISATGHTPGEAATCTTAQICTVCKAELVAAGHKYDEGKVTTEATCEEEGVKTFTCTVCEETATTLSRVFALSARKMIPMQW